MKTKYTNAAYNKQLDLLVKWSADDFVIIGDDELITDETLLNLMKGQMPEGWAIAPL